MIICMLDANNDIIEYIIDKLNELKLKAEFEDRKRGKKRFVSKVSCYDDLINFLKEVVGNEYMDL